MSCHAMPILNKAIEKNIKNKMFYPRKKFSNLGSINLKENKMFA